jgi:hypothetical protein
VGTTRFIGGPSNKGAVSPDREKTMLFWILLGLGIPGGIVFLKEFLDKRVYTEKDIRRGTSAPFLGMIGQARGDSSIVVKKGSRSAVSCAPTSSLWPQGAR